MAKGNKGLAVDFTGVESGGGSAKVPEGDYHVKVTKVVLGESKNSGNPMLTWTFEILEGKQKGKKLIDRSTLTKESLWKLKNILEGLGHTVPSKKVALNLESYIDEEAGITVIDDEYNNKPVSRISDYFPTDDLEEEDEEEEDDDEEEEEPVAKKKSKKDKKSKKADEDEDLEEIDLDTV